MGVTGIPDLPGATVFIRSIEPFRLTVLSRSFTLAGAHVYPGLNGVAGATGK